MKIFCILNPLSADGASLKMRPVMEAFLKSEKVEYEFFIKDEDLEEKVHKVLIEIQKEKQDVVIAGLGGDGTHHALINGIMSFRDLHPESTIPPYAIIPLGTGNNIAKSFALILMGATITSILKSALKIAIHGVDKKVDLGRVNGRWFLDAFTVGIDAHILAGRNRDRSALRKNTLLYRLFKGYPLYLYNTVKCLYHYKKIDAEIVVDGEGWHNGFFYNLIINNTAIYAGELDLADSAPADDGYLDAVLFSGSFDYLRRYLLAHRYLPKQLRTLSTKNKRNLEHIRGKNFEIHLESPMLAQIAGEEFPHSKEFYIKTFHKIFTIKASPPKAM